MTTSYIFRRGDFRKTAEADFFQDLVDSIYGHEDGADIDTLDVQITLNDAC